MSCQPGAAPPALAAWALVLALLLPLPSGARDLALTGSLGQKALLMIDGSPRTVAVGSTVDGITLVSLADGRAVVESRGQRQTLLLGASPVRLGGDGGPAQGRQIVLTAGTGGHFITEGQINGRAVRFMVDTGATAVSMSAAEADRIGLRYRDGRPVQLNTANGAVPGHLVKLASVRVRDVELYDIEAVVAAREMPYVLLGNSFLGRFQMKRENEVLTLERRY